MRDLLDTEYDVVGGGRGVVQNSQITINKDVAARVATSIAATVIVPPSHTNQDSPAGVTTFGPGNAITTTYSTQTATGSSTLVISNSYTP